MRLYHGSPHKFSSFDVKYAFISLKSLVQEGPGFYFTNDVDNAKIYGKNGYLYVCDVEPRKLVPTNGKPKVNEVTFLINGAPNKDEALENFDENPIKAMREVIRSYTKYVENPHDSFTMIWNDIYGTDTVSYLKRMIELGYDGVAVDVYGDIRHYIIFNPNVITIEEVVKL